MRHPLPAPLQRAGVLTATAAALLLAAGCAPGSAPAPSTPGTNPSEPPRLDATSLAPMPRPLEPDEVVHFLRRTTFGPTPDGLDSFDPATLEATVGRMLEIEMDSAFERGAREAEIGRWGRPLRGEISRWWLHTLTRNPNGLHEMLGLFWHDHFAASHDVLAFTGMPLYRDHVVLMRSMAVGNLREFLYRVIEDGMMLVWLDGVLNSRTTPNENLARELLEVFTLGAGNGYTEDDVANIARALTGWRLRTNHLLEDEVYFDVEQFDATEKTIFGITANFTGRQVVDLVLAERPAAEYVATQLFEFFCYESPPPSVVAELGAILREANYELRPLIQTILTSEAFFSERSRAPRVKRPLDHIIGFMRTTGLEAPFDRVLEEVQELGMAPGDPPNVFGWPEGTEWYNVGGLLDRRETIVLLVTQRLHQATLGVDLRRLLPRSEETSTAEIVDRLCRLLGIQPLPEERADWIGYLDSRTVSDAAGGVVLEPDPFNIENADHIDERIRGLLQVLALHPQSLTR